MAIVITLVFALLLLGAPIGLNAANHPLGVFPSSVMIIVGLMLLLGCAVVLTVTKLYIRTRADEAFVRTGMGGMKIVRDGGALVLPVLHQVVRVSLATIRLEVSRAGADALITLDKLRADIKAEFFVRVQPEDSAINNAARSLGNRSEEGEYRRGQTGPQNAVAALIQDKLVSALRTASARKTLEQLNSDREEFLKEVISMVTSDLAHNGFTLESVTISKLDQTDVQFLKSDNIFDAQGMRTIAEITQTNLTARNEIVRKGEQERTAQDVATRQKVLELERTREEAIATQATQVITIQAEQARLAQEKKIEADLSVQLATVAQIKATQVAKQEQERDIAVAEQQRLESLTKAQQSVEVAKRDQEKAIAVAEAERALAQAKLADSEAEREKARQGVITVEEVAKADRSKQTNVIAAQAAAEQAYVKEAKAADAAAYKVNAEADARKASADADAVALQKKAEAEAVAMTRRAEGEKAAVLAKAAGQQATLEAEAAGNKAIAMVPVDVAARQVEIDKARVETVLKPELEAREKSGAVAQEFELSKIRIEKEAEVRIEAAKAMVTLYGKITANVYGTPEDVAKMGQAFSNGMGLSQMIAGFMDGANNTPDVLTAVNKATEIAGKVGTAIAERINPKGEP
jgi:flotillin